MINKAVIKYDKEEPQTKTFVDKSISGSSEGGENTGSVKASEKVLEALKALLSVYLEKGNIGSCKAQTTIMGDKESKKFRFDVEVGEGKIQYSIANEGARGCYLNASWNPTRVLTGQNIYSPNVSSPSLLGISFELLPADIIELPFKILVKLLDKELPSGWVGRKTILKQLADENIYYRELHITTYSGKFNGEKSAQMCMQMLDAMGGMRKVIGLSSSDLRDRITLSIREFANAIFSSYKKQTDEGDFYESVAFIKCKSKYDDQRLYRLSLYDKLREIKASGDLGNRVLLGHPGVYYDIMKRIRIELQTTPTAFNEVASFRKIAMDGVKDLDQIKTLQSGFLRKAFSTLDIFEQKRARLVVAAMKDLHFDWLVFPRNPDKLMETAGQAPDSAESIVLSAWRECEEIHLPGKNQAAKTIFKGTLSRAEVADTYKFLREKGLDVTRISYLEASALWSNLVSATLTRKEYLALEEEDRQNMLSGSTQYKLRPSIMLEAAQRAILLKKNAMQQLSSVSVARNLLGE